MKTFTITKEQILGLYNNANVPWHTIRDNFKDWFPDAFKEELEIGKWYKSQLGSIVYLSKDDTKSFYKHYGFDTLGRWFEEDILDKDCAFASIFFPATKEQIESALIKEAKKRGFKEGVNFIPVNGKCSLKRNFERYAYIEEDNKLLFSNYTIFSNGKWAEVIQEESKLEKLEKQILQNIKGSLSNGIIKLTQKEVSKVFRKLAETLDKE